MPAGDSFWPVPALSREASPPPPRAFPTTSKWSGLGCPMPPVLTHVRPVGPGWREGADPTPCLTLSGLACVQRLDVGRASAPPHPLPGLAEQSLHELMRDRGGDRQAGQWPKKGGGQ